MKIKMIINPGEIWSLNSDYEISLYFNRLSLFIRRENISHRIPFSHFPFLLFSQNCPPRSHQYTSDISFIPFHQNKQNIDSFQI